MKLYDSSKVSSYNLNGFQRLARPLTDVDLIGVRKYSHFVRVIRYVEPFSNGWKYIVPKIAVGEELVKELDRLYPISLMFPNLRLLVCETAALLASSPLRLFLGPQLRSLEFRISSIDPRVLCCITETLAERCPLLEVLKLNVGVSPDEASTYGDEFHSRILRFFTKCVNLRHLSIESLPLQWSGIEALARLPNLEELRWKGRGDKPYSPERSHRYFPRLSRYTQQESAEISSHNTLASRITSNRLELFDVRCRPSICFDLHQLLSTMHDRFDHQSLTSLILRGPSHHEWPQSQEEFAEISCLMPALSFHNLRTFHLCDVCLLDLDDQAIFMMASSWPNLQTLYLKGLTGNCRWKKPYRITPKGFFALVRDCSKLTQLSILMNFAADNLEDEIRRMETGEGSLGTNLNFLAIGDSMIAEPERVAGIFCRLFPKVRKVSYSSRAGGWRVVNTSLAQRRPGR
jgi:hypothetical protein